MRRIELVPMARRARNRRAGPAPPRTRVNGCDLPSTRATPLTRLGGRSASNCARARPGSRLSATPRPSHDGTPAEHAVERKVMRIERLKAAAALVAGEVLAVAIDLPFRLLARVIDMRDVHHSLAEIEGRLRPPRRIGHAGCLRTIKRSIDNLDADACGDDRSPAVRIDVERLGHRRACARSRCGESPRKTVSYFSWPRRSIGGHHI